MPRIAGWCSEVLKAVPIRVPQAAFATMARAVDVAAQRGQEDDNRADAQHGEGILKVKEAKIFQKRHVGALFLSQSSVTRKIAFLRLVHNAIGVFCLFSFKNFQVFFVKF